jgi:hypothetical protein
MTFEFGFGIIKNRPLIRVETARRRVLIFLAWRWSFCAVGNDAVTEVVMGPVTVAVVKK